VKKRVQAAYAPGVTDSRNERWKNATSNDLYPFGHLSVWHLVHAGPAEQSATDINIVYYSVQYDVETQCPIFSVHLYFCKILINNISVGSCTTR